jgi:hypothetical protein
MTTALRAMRSCAATAAPPPAAAGSTCHVARTPLTPKEGCGCAGVSW